MHIKNTALEERIKELTCLYEVSSIIVNADAVEISETLKAIGKSLKKGFQFPEQTEILIEIPLHSYKTGRINKEHQISADVILFNKIKGRMFASIKKKSLLFLDEEQPLLDNVALKLGNLLERIEIQQNEISLKRQMERADRLKILGELTAGIAHELNTPLANILGFAELLKDDFKNVNQTTQDVDKIISNAIFAREVVKKLMFFACEMPQEKKEINIVPNIKNALNLLEATFRKEQVKHTIVIDDLELNLKADTVQITQILFNLIINAIYFSPKNGLVTIKAHQTKTHIVLEIFDEGEGILEENLDKIFQPFFSTKSPADGTGLGLSVVHGIVASHNGTIKAKNNKFKGACFTVKLPKS